MSPLLVALALACALLVVVVAVLAAVVVSARRRAARQQQAHGRDLAALRDQLSELTARQAELEAAGSPPAADYVITFDQPEPIQVSTQRVVSATLGEPLIKAAAFGHGVRRALREDRRAHLAYQVRREYRRRRKSARAAARRSMRQAR